MEVKKSVLYSLEGCFECSNSPCRFHGNVSGVPFEIVEETKERKKTKVIDKYGCNNSKYQSGDLVE